MKTQKNNRTNLIYLIITLVNSILFYGVYAVLMEYPFWKTVTIVYLAVSIVIGFTFVIYNRFFVRKGVTEEMLPTEWSDEQKRAYVENGKTRLRRSKWLLTILIPLLFAFFMDLFVLFIYDPYIVPAIDSIVNALGG